MEEWDKSMEEQAHQCQPAAQMVAPEVVAKARLESLVPVFTLVFALALALALSPAYVPLASVGDVEVAQMEGNRRCCHLQRLVPGGNQV